MIKISDKYYLETDALNYILKEKKIRKDGKKKGEEYYENIAYFGRIEHLYNYIIEKEIKENIELLNNIEKVIELKREISKEDMKC